MNLLQNFHLPVIHLCSGRRAIPLQTFTTTRHSIRKLSIVMVLSPTFTQFVPETTKFRKITLNKGHFAVQGHSRSPIFTGKGASPSNNFWHQKTIVPGLSYGEKKLPKSSTGWVGCTNVTDRQTDRQTTDRQTTDGRAMAYSERERKFTSANKTIASKNLLGIL